MRADKSSLGQAHALLSISVRFCTNINLIPPAVITLIHWYQAFTSLKRNQAIKIQFKTGLIYQESYDNYGLLRTKIASNQKWPFKTFFSPRRSLMLPWLCFMWAHNNHTKNKKSVFLNLLRNSMNYDPDIRYSRWTGDFTQNFTRIRLVLGTYRSITRLKGKISFLWIC